MASLLMEHNPLETFSKNFIDKDSQDQRLDSNLQSHEVTVIENGTNQPNKPNEHNSH